VAARGACRLGRRSRRLSVSEMDGRGRRLRSAQRQNCPPWRLGNAKHVPAGAGVPLPTKPVLSQWQLPLYAGEKRPRKCSGWRSSRQDAVQVFDGTNGGGPTFLIATTGFRSPPRTEIRGGSTRTVKPVWCDYAAKGTKWPCRREPRGRARCLQAEAHEQERQGPHIWIDTHSFWM